MKRVIAAVLAIAEGVGTSGARAATEAELTGLVETEARKVSGGGAASSEMGVRQAALGARVQLNQKVSAKLVWLYDQAAADPGRLDVAEVRLQMGETGFIAAGRQYLPFGSYETFMASEPLTLQMSEARGDLFGYGVESETLLFDLYNFQTPVAVTGRAADAFDWGTRLVMRDGAFEIGSSYVSNLAHSDAFQAVGGGVAKAVPAYSYSVNWTAETFTFYSERVFAAEPFFAGDLGGEISGAAEPEAITYETGFGLSATTVLAWTLQKTRDAAFLGLPLEYQALAFSIQLAPETRLTFEWGESHDYQGVSQRVSAIEMAAEF